MSELRKDPLSHRWVVISKDRADRPIEFTIAPAHRDAVRCPFCFGNEADTPTAVAEYPPADSRRKKSWQVRVVPNRFPAVKPNLVWPLNSREGEAPAEPCGSEKHFAEKDGSAGASPSQVCASINDSTDLQNCLPGFGVHEVIIESPEHAVHLTDLSDEQMRLMLQAYRDRMAALRENPHLRYVQIFKNVGAAGGASIEHAHSQLIALPFVPGDVQIELNSARQWWRDQQQCIFCAMWQNEKQQAVRTVAESENFFAFCPYASRFPFETWLMPKPHASHFETTSSATLGELATFLKHVVRRIEQAAPGAAYNFLLHSSPFDSTSLDHFHWHFEIFPRLTTTAGFEFGTNCFINPVPPEEAAAILRDKVG